MKNNSHTNINFHQFSKLEKARLKQRITGSVYRFMRRQNGVKYVMGITAATIVAFLSLVIFNAPNPNTSSIEDFSKTVKDLEPSTKVQLVLSHKHQIEISENNSSISYSSTGEQVQIGKEHSVSQQTSHKNKVVFNTLIVPFGKRSEIVLSDGSKVWLNSGSKLIFPAQFKTDKREVFLEGEAVFEVVHHQKQPFIVKTEQQEIEVLGTLFNVSNYKDDRAVYTVLQSGSIQINVTDGPLFGNQNSVKIVPGTLATFDKEDKVMTTTSVETAPYFSWRDGVFIFKKHSLESILRKISRYYNVEVVIRDKNLAEETFSGALDVKESIQNVMKTIKATQSSEFNYTLTQDNRLIIN